MSDATIGIEVTANTSAATRALKDLEDATRSATDAADAAGEGQKTLAQKAAGAKEAQLAAADAARRAQAALAEHNATVAAHGRESKEAAASLAKLKAAQAEAAKQSAAAEQALAAVAEETAKAVRESDKLTPALARVAREVKQAGAQAERTASEVRRLELAITAAGKAGEQSGKGLSGFMASFAGNLAANAVSTLTGKLGEVGLHALDTAANFERMKTALTTTLGSTEAAAAAFGELQAFAAATPYSLEEVTQGFLKLKARGLDGSEKALRAYGDTASAMGKSLDDMVEAVADAVNGEGERLKEFGIGLKVNGDKASITFRGVTKEITRDAKSIEAELIRLGQVNFAGGMEAQSRTLGGMISTLKDGFDQFIVGVMDSGITGALKSIMTSFSGMGETGELLGDILGVGLGGAFTILAGTVKVATTAIEAFSAIVNFVLTPVRMLKDAASETAASFKDFSEFEAMAAQQAAKDAEAQAQLVAEYRATIDTSTSLTGHMQRLIDLSGEYALSVAAEGVAHIAASQAAERRMSAETAMWDKLAKSQAAAEEKAAFDQFEAANAMGPALPPGFERKKGKGKKKPTGPSFGDAMALPEQMAKRERAERESAFAAEVAAFEKESALQDRRVAGIDREIEAIEARGVAEAQHVDFIFVTLEMESEAAQRREALIDARLDKEMELAQWQVRNAKTQEQRERAQTRLEEAEHAKRIRALDRAAKDEAKTARQREQVFGALARAHNAIGEEMVDAAFAAAEGEKIAIGEMLQTFLKGLTKKHTLLALAEGALAAGAFASYRYAEGGQHLAAAGLHTGVAVLAGVGAYAVGKVVDIPQGGSRGGDGGGSNTSRATGSQRERSDDGDLQAQEVPVSHEQLRRADPSAGAKAGGASIVFNAPVNIYGAGGKAEFIEDLRRALDRQDRGGRRPRN